MYALLVILLVLACALIYMLFNLMLSASDVSAEKFREEMQAYKTAKLVRILDPLTVGVEQHLYKVNPPVKWTNYNYDAEQEFVSEYVVVSAATVYYLNESKPETYIFPADSDGNIINWGELDGSFQGELNHVKALNNAGYEVLS